MKIKIIIAVLLVTHLGGIIYMIASGNMENIFIASLTSVFLGVMLWSLMRKKKKQI